MSTPSPVNVRSRVLEFYEKDAPIGTYKLPIRDHAQQRSHGHDQTVMASNCL